MVELEEPDLAKYAAIDMAALRDVSQLGADHLSAVEAILHSTPGIQPGYLPEKEATALLMGSMRLMTLASYLDSRSAQLKCEALGGIQMALAGSPPNCLYHLLKTNFGYAPSSTSSTSDSEPSPGSKRPASSEHEVPAKIRTTHSGGQRTSAPSKSSKNSDGNFPSAEASHAAGFKPSTDHRRWSHTGLAADYQPRKMEGDENYSCPFPLCDFVPCQKFDAVATHIRRHLNIAIQCHYCDRLFWSCAGWTKHCTSSHSKLPKVPSDATDPGIFQPPSISLPTSALREEEQVAISEAERLPSTNYDIEPPFSSIDLGDSNSPVKEEDSPTVHVV